MRRLRRLVVIGSLSLYSMVKADESSSGQIASDGIVIVTDVRTGVNYSLDSRLLQAQQNLVEGTIKFSKRNKSAVVIVDKLARRLDLYDKGKFLESYVVSLGRNPYDDKVYEFDGCTPEGMYKITRIRDGKVDQTFFYKALMIDYPTRRDWTEFRAAKAKESIPEMVDNPGGDIEIHGHGNAERDWTAGCVALMNDDIDKLFKHVYVGMPVTIVKSYQKK